MRLLQVQPHPTWSLINSDFRQKLVNLSGWPEPIISALLFLLVANVAFVFVFNSTSYQLCSQGLNTGLWITLSLSTAKQPLTPLLYAPPIRWGCYNYFSFTTAWSITEQLQSHPLGKCFLGQTELSLSALQVGQIPWPLPCSCGWVSPVRCLPGTWSVPADSWAASCNTNPLSRFPDLRWCCDL